MRREDDVFIYAPEICHIHIHRRRLGEDEDETTCRRNDAGYTSIVLIQAGSEVVQRGTTRLPFVSVARRERHLLNHCRVAALYRYT